MACDGANLVGELPYAEEVSEYFTFQGAEIAVFDLYFASIRSMQFHPGAGRGFHVPLTARECMIEALEMIKIRREVVRMGKCRGDGQQQLE